MLRNVKWLIYLTDLLTPFGVWDSLGKVLCSPLSYLLECSCAGVVWIGPDGSYGRRIRSVSTRPMVLNLSLSQPPLNPPTRKISFWFPSLLMRLLYTPELHANGKILYGAVLTPGATSIPLGKDIPFWSRTSWNGSPPGTVTLSFYGQILNLSYYSAIGAPVAPTTTTDTSWNRNLINCF